VSLSLDSILRRSDNVVFRKISNEHVLVPIVASAADVESSSILNEIGSAIWDKMDGKKSLKDIVTEIQREYNVEGHQLEKDVISFVSEMMAAKLIEA
jgi:hypothetical protein